MATVCSGTDAPVVAMRVAKETLQRKGLEFPFEHVMSCEIEPYKQSFIARNNPGVLLFPDVAALGATPRGEKATTAYGALADVPSAGMIVAGTSCKDFSNLKGKDKKSIEQMGTSGETFIGFVNLLFAQRCERASNAHARSGAPPTPQTAVLRLRCWRPRGRSDWDSGEPGGRRVDKDGTLHRGHPAASIR
eukprot:3420233-Prymnesium_polylepis.1